uniref:DNA-dependent RNA polymerase 2 subunit Rpb1 n=1 Tax=Bodo saltans virus TaxID=2024608 RepID=UPI002481ED87|nr:DNA-dependent RNA polymerase 2 subunit Rpb1 [Bodo saltans virus]
MDTEIYTTDVDTIKPICKIRFDILGNEEIKRISAMRDTNGIEIVDLFDNSEPKRGGLIDLRMGTTSNEHRCVTCGLSNNYCIGHSSHINLAEYCFHPGYLPKVTKILSSICINCSKILLNKNEAELKVKTKTAKERLAYVVNACKTVSHCQKANFGCGTPHPKLKYEVEKRNGGISIVAEFELEQNAEDAKNPEFVKTKTKLVLTAEMVYEILKNISDEDCEIMGLDPTRTRPEYMIHKIMYVPPVSMRPSARGEFAGGMIIADDLTVKLADIIKSNLRIIKNKENHSDNNTRFHGDYAHLLQYHVATYMENEALGMMKAEQKGRPIKSAASRLKGKFGRIRGNLMGKRGDFTARTVITADPSVDHREMRVPVAIAQDLTFPETVTPDNIEFLTTLVSRGADNYPGANIVIKLSEYTPGKKLSLIGLRYREEGVTLHYGDIVERHLIDGDYVILNRQPTLHKQSMMAMRIKVVNDTNLMTFGLSASVTKPFNADFDGDEMNIFLPQSIQTLVELQEIAAADLQFIHPSVSKSSIGIVQDGLIGIYNLTSPTVNVDWRNAMNMMSYTSLEDFTQIPKYKDINGSKLYSMIIPNKVNLSTSALKVANGNITEGRVTTKNLGFKEKNTLIQLVWDEYGKDVTENFIDDTQRLANNYNLWYGFSVGYGDIERPPEMLSQIDKIFETKRLEVQHLVTEVENNPELMKKDALEMKMYSKLKSINEEVQKLVINTLSDTNGFKVMANSGSKGKADNVGQMMGCLGLHAFEGKLIPKKYNERTLPYYHINDDTSESRGLTRRSFIEGLEWQDFIYQMLHGRSGLIDSAVKCLIVRDSTAETGYMQRKLVKSLEDIMVKYDGTVRNANESIIQLIYGDSGADTISQFDYEISFLKMNNELLQQTHKFTDQELKNFNFSSKDNDEYYETLRTLRDKIRKNVQKAKLDYMGEYINFMIPINLTRIVEELTENKEKNTKNDLTPKHIVDSINELLSNKKTPLVCMTKRDGENPNSFKYRDEQSHKTILKASLLNAFSPKKVLLDYNLTKEKFDNIMQFISKSFIKNTVEPGEMVGVIAATATGEPLTQMNLNSFHQSSVARMTATTQGVPRMREVFSVTKNLRTPQMMIYLTEDVRNKKDIANKIASNIKYTTFSEVMERINIYYDPKPKINEGFMKSDNIVPVSFSQKGNKNNCQADISGLPWLLRIGINREKMAEKEITLLDITSQFCSWWSIRYIDAKNLRKEERRVMNKITQLSVLSNSDNDKGLIVHIRFNVKDNDKDKFDLNTIKDFITFVLEKFKLKGNSGINDITAIPEDKSIIFDKKTGDTKIESEYVIYTNGVNLTDLRYFTGIDLNRTISNDIVQVYNTFGIEIARSVLLKEIFTAYSTQGQEVNYQHIAIIVDQMTMTGAINSIDRHGLNKSDSDPLSRASFEKPVEQLWNAAIFHEDDNIKGVSARIMCGQVINGGTGYCDIMLDHEMLEKVDYVESDYAKKFTELKTETTTADILNKDNDDVFMPM